MHNACDARKERVVASHADILARENSCTSLTNNDLANPYFLAISALDTEVLRLRITEIFRCSAGFCVCHTMAMNIPEIRQQIKNVSEDVVGEWGTILIMLSVGLASFGLGRLSALEETKPIVSIREASAESELQGMYIGGLVVASRKGSAYHYPWCPGAQTIVTQNRIWFPSEEAARVAGYAPAKNCKGLGTVSSQ